MSETNLASLLDFTRDGEWGLGEPTEGFSPALVVRGTDFADIRLGKIDTLPLRYIRSDILERKKILGGDTIIESAGGTKDQPTGRTVFVGDKTLERASLPLICASFSRFLRPNTGKVVPRFLFWKLQDEYRSRRMFPYHVQHTGVARFQYTQFAEGYLFEVPELPEQRAIAAVLSALDDKIELNRRMNETLEASARALFRDWFVDFGPTRAKMAGAAPYLAPDLWSLFPATLDAEGKPIGWEWSTIGKEVDAVGGSTPSTKDDALWNGDIAWTTPKDLSGLNSPVLMRTGRTISEAGLRTISSGLLPVGTVLMSSRAPVGYLAITQIPLAINQGYIAMRCDGRVSNWHAYLWAKENMDAILQNANGSTFQEISKSNFRPLPVLVANKTVRKRFDHAVQPMFEQIISNERESCTLAETRDLLLPKLMSGEIRVAQAEKLAGDSL